MIKNYKFNYDFHEAEVELEVDTEKFTAEMAKQILEFFTWDYDKDADPIDEVMKKYAIACIAIGTAENYNAYGVMRSFDDNEGFCKLDGSMGLKLISFYKYEFEESKLNVEITENADPQPLVSEPDF